MPGHIFLPEKMKVISRNNSIDCTKELLGLLSEEKGFNMFKSFLESEYAAENLNFWRAVEDYHKVAEVRLLPEAQSIYKSFIQEGAANELNITAPVRARLQETFAPLVPSKINRKIFDAAQKCILDLMRSDNFTRFLNTPQYQSLVTEAKWNEEVNLSDFLTEIYNMKMEDSKKKKKR